MAYTGDTNEIITPETFKDLVGEVARKLGLIALDKVAVFAVGGMPAAMVGRRLGVQNIGALSSYKQGERDYREGDLVRLRDVGENGNTRPLAGQVVGVGDEATDSGGLLRRGAQHVKALGGIPLTYALVARNLKRRADMPVVYGETCKGTPPKPYWKFEQHEPGVHEIADQLKDLSEKNRPNAILAVGDCFTAAAELAKILGINGRNAGGLPVDKGGQPDTSWLTVGNCEDLRVLVLGTTEAGIDPAADIVRTNGGLALPHMVPASA